MVAALALLLVMAMDWYSSTVGERAREVEKLSEPSGGTVADDTQRENQQRPREQAQGEEKNAWQAPGLIDKLILIGLLGTIVLAVAGAWLRAAGRRFEPPSTPATATAVVATVTGLLVAYRIIQEPGLRRDHHRPGRRAAGAGRAGRDRPGLARVDAPRGRRNGLAGRARRRARAGAEAIVRRDASNPAWSAPRSSPSRGR